VQHRIVALDELVLCDLAECGQRADPQRATGQRLDPGQPVEPRDVQDARGRRDPEPQPVEQLRASGEERGIGLGAGGEHLREARPAGIAKRQH
jgi:hypothetical protein